MSKLKVDSNKDNNSVGLTQNATEKYHRFVEFELKENGIIAEVYFDTYKDEELFSRTIDRYTISNDKLSKEKDPRRFLLHSNQAKLSNMSNSHTIISIISDTMPNRPKTSQPDSGTDYIDPYQNFSATINYTAISTLPVRTCVKKFGFGKKQHEISNVPQAIKLMTSLIHGKVSDRDLKKIHADMIQRYPFTAFQSNIGVNKIIRKNFDLNRNFDNFKKEHFALEYLGILAQEDRLIGKIVQAEQTPAM